MRTGRDSMVTKIIFDATKKTGLTYDLPEPIDEESLIREVNLSKFGINLV
jgi:hypothetical protein